MPHMPVLSYETIADDLIVCTSQLHRFGTDAVLLTEFPNTGRRTVSATWGQAAALSQF